MKDVFLGLLGIIYQLIVVVIVFVLVVGFYVGIPYYLVGEMLDSSGFKLGLLCVVSATWLVLMLISSKGVGSKMQGR